MDELIPPPDDPISIGRSNLGRTAGQFTRLIVACYTIAIALAEAQTEPSYYIYHGKPKPLSLDPHCVAIHLQAAAEERAPLTALPNGLTSRGFTSADLETQPLPDWVVVNTRHVAATTPRSQSVS